MCTVNATNIPLEDLASRIGEKIKTKITIGRGVDGSQPVTVSISKQVPGPSQLAWLAVLGSIAKDQGLKIQPGRSGNGLTLVKQP